MMPFAVIGAEGQYNVNGREVRGRQYPWGIIEVDNAKHCDFSYLRHALLTYFISFCAVDSAKADNMIGHIRLI